MCPSLSRLSAAGVIPPERYAAAAAAAAEVNAWFPALRCRSRIRSRIRFRSRFRKNRVRTCHSVCRCCWGMCAALARQAQEAGRRVSRAKEWAELQARTNGRYGKIELYPIWTDERQRRTYGNGERYFLRIATEFLRNSYVLCYGNGYGNGYVTVEISHKIWLLDDRHTAFTLGWGVGHTDGVEGGVGVGRRDVVWAGFRRLLSQRCGP